MPRTWLRATANRISDDGDLLLCIGSVCAPRLFEKVVRAVFHPLVAVAFRMCYPLKASPTSQNTPLHWCPSTARLTRAALHPEKFRIVLGLPDLTARYCAALRSPGSGKWPFGPVAPARYRIAAPAVSSSPSRRVHTPNPCVHAPPCLAPGHPGVTFPVVDLPDKSICSLPYIERPPLTLSQDGEAEGS